MSELRPYGYFFNGYQPEKGEYLLLPDGHGQLERARAQKEADTDYEFCAFFYSKDSENYIPFSQENADHTTLVVDKNSTYLFKIDYQQYEVIPDLSVIQAIANISDYEYYQRCLVFEKAKNWLLINFPETEIRFTKEKGNCVFTSNTVIEATNSAGTSDNDLISLIIEQYNALKPQ